MPGMTIEDTVEKVGPDIEALLADGVPRSKRMITAELVAICPTIKEITPPPDALAALPSKSLMRRHS